MIIVSRECCWTYSLLNRFRKFINKKQTSSWSPPLPPLSHFFWRRSRKEDNKAAWVGGFLIGSQMPFARFRHMPPAPCGNSYFIFIQSPHPTHEIAKYVDGERKWIRLLLILLGNNMRKNQWLGFRAPGSVCNACTCGTGEVFHVEMPVCSLLSFRVSVPEFQIRTLLDWILKNSNLNFQHFL